MPPPAINNAATATSATTATSPITRRRIWGAGLLTPLSCRQSDLDRLHDTVRTVVAIDDRSLANGDLRLVERDDRLVAHDFGFRVDHERRGRLALLLFAGLDL